MWPYRIGERVSTADIFKFATDITQAYRDAGYALSFAVVPEQDLDSDEGHFKIQIVEGFVDSYEVRGFILQRVEDSVETVVKNITVERPVRSNTLERYLLLADDISGVTATGVLAPSEGESAARMYVSSSYDPFSASVGVNSYLSDNLGRELISLSSDFRGLLTGDDLIRATFNVSPDVTIFKGGSLLFSTYLGGEGLNVGASVGGSYTSPEQANLASFTSSSVDSSIFISYPLIRLRNNNLSIGSEFATDDTESKLAGVIISKDSVRTLSFWLDWRRTLQSGSSFSFRTETRYGLDIIKAKGTSQDGSNGEFSTIDLLANYTQILGSFWGGSLSMPISLYTQQLLTDKKLLSGAECSYGGRRYGFGFSPGIISGDECLLGSVRFSWLRGIGGYMVYNAYIAFDAGEVVNRETVLQPGDWKHNFASSATFGNTVSLRNGVSLNLEVSGSITKPKGFTNIDSQRYNFSVQYGF